MEVNTRKYLFMTKEKKWWQATKGLPRVWMEQCGRRVVEDLPTAVRPLEASQCSASATEVAPPASVLQPLAVVCAIPSPAPHSPPSVGYQQAAAARARHCKSSTCSAYSQPAVHSKPLQTASGRAKEGVRCHRKFSFQTIRPERSWPNLNWKNSCCLYFKYFMT